MVGLMTESIRVTQEAGTASIFLNRPERRNALSLNLLAELSDILSSEVREDTTAVIITGAGGTFSAGADFADLTGTVKDLEMDDAIEKVTRSILELPVPVIAAIDGPCMGGAVDLALSCDHRIASRHAIFQVPAARLGLLYNPDAVLRMHRRIGRDAVVRILILGERLDAVAALQAGVVSSVVEDASYPAAVELARLCADNVRASVASTKRLLNAIDSDDYDPAEWEEQRRDSLSSPERRLRVETVKKRHGY
jgi:enoyl-CoA hydratase/carnithine racemase